jgi:dual oxidase
LYFEVNGIDIYHLSISSVSDYSVEREHSGLRHIAGYGVTVTRGAASAQMFCYATLLLTMCRNTITHLRETFLHKFIPFDAFVSMHKYIARLGLFFSIIHVVGHAINFYHISTQTADDLTCIFRDYFRQ